MVHPVGIEPATFWSVARRSIQLSYGCQPSRSCPATPLIYTVKMECQMQSAKNNEKVSSSGSNPLIKKTSDPILSLIISHLTGGAFYESSISI